MDLIEEQLATCINKRANGDHKTKALNCEDPQHKVEFEPKDRRADAAIYMFEKVR